MHRDQPINEIEIAVTTQLKKVELQVLYQLGVDSIDALRREVTQRLSCLSQSKSGGLEASSETLPLPRTEDGLQQLAERMLKLEALQDVVRWRWTQRDEQRAAYRKFLLCGINSPQTLLRQLSAQSSGNLPQGVANCALNDALQRLDLKCLKTNTVEAIRAELESRERNAPRTELIEEGDRPFLVTAPHNIYLCRDGNDPHLMEEFTTVIAQRIAKQLNGSSLAWTRSEQHRSEILWAQAKSASAGGPPEESCAASFLDYQNRDPNYLHRDELPGNEWFLQMRNLADSWRELQKTETLFHIDVHGCRDPPCYPTHMTVGLGAMQQQLQRECQENGGKGYKAASGKGSGKGGSVEAFGQALKSELSAALGSIASDISPKAPLVRVVVPDPNAECHEALSGAWQEETNRLTQTQQAIHYAGFTHACQLEMSRALRRVLFNDTTACIRLANALRSAWAKAKRSN